MHNSLTLDFLASYPFLTPAHVDLVRTHKNPDDLAMAFACLYQAQLLTEEHQGLVFASARPDKLAEAFYYLQKAGLFTAANRNLIVNHPSFAELGNIFFYLHEAQILTQKKFEQIVAQAHLESLKDVLLYLRYARIFTPENFSLLMEPRHHFLWRQEIYEHIWAHIPHVLLTNDNFQRLLTASRQPNPKAAIMRVRDWILQAHLTDEMVPHLNVAQSTHTASVHRMVSLAAVKLMDNYGLGLNFLHHLHIIQDWVESLFHSTKHEAAKRYLRWIMTNDVQFRDPSGVSIQELLVLSYVAIHDEQKRSCSLEDAKALYIEALYEIQRGYNLNDLGVDQGGEDVPICIAGGFNKLMEKLTGIHPDVEVYYVSHQAAYFKFPLLAKAHALAYLNAMPSNTAKDYRNIKAIVTRLQMDGSLESIWQAIKAGVKAQLWEEFAEAYAYHEHDPRFVSLLDNGVYLNAPDLSGMETALMGTLGFEAYLAEQARICFAANPMLSFLQQHGLWANRHANPKAQEHFDKHYGLTIVAR